MSTPAQKKAIKEFRAVTSVTEKVATDALAANAYNLERALDDFYTNKNKYGSASSSSSSSAAKTDNKKLAAIFDKYTTPEDKDTIEGEKLQAFFTDLGINVAGPGPLALAWQYKCSQFAAVERKEFNEYYQSHGIDTLDKMKADAKRVEGLLADKKNFKEFYRWLFDFVKEDEERKTLDNPVAFGLWSVVLPLHFPLTTQWIAFCKKTPSLKMVSNDLWQQLWEFAKDVDKDLSNYDEDGAWPVIIDEFVADFKKAKK